MCWKDPNFWGSWNHLETSFWICPVPGLEWVERWDSAGAVDQKTLSHGSPSMRLASKRPGKNCMDFYNPALEVRESPFCHSVLVEALVCLPRFVGMGHRSHLFSLIFRERRREGQRKRGERREERWFVVPCTYVFTGWFFYVPCLGIEHTTFEYQDGAL